MELVEKWELVKAHYEKAYQIRFAEIPVPVVVHYLYSQMVKHEKEMNDYYHRHPFLGKNYLRITGKIIPPKDSKSPY